VSANLDKGNHETKEVYLRKQARKSDNKHTVHCFLRREEEKKNFKGRRMKETTPIICANSFTLTDSNQPAKIDNTILAPVLSGINKVFENQ